MTWRRLGAALGVLVLGVVGGLSAQSTISRHTEIFNFLYGVKLNGGTTITGASGTGTAAVVLPVNSVGLGTEVSGFAEPVTFCGQLVDGSVSAATVYLGPSTAQLNGTPTDLVAGGAACDALESTVEATADTALSTLALKVVGMRCKQSAASGAGKTTTYTMRSAEADVATTDGGSTALTCSVAGATATECKVSAGSTTNIAASATTAMKVLTDANLSTQDGWCRVLVAWP
jgi:hypothetical protein